MKLLSDKELKKLSPQARQNTIVSMLEYLRDNNVGIKEVKDLSVQLLKLYLLDRGESIDVDFSNKIDPDDAKMIRDDVFYSDFSERIKKVFSISNINFSLSPYVMISGVKTVYGDIETIYKEWDYKSPLNKWRSELKKRYPNANIRGISKNLYDKLKKEQEKSNILQSIKKLSKDVINSTPEFTQFKDCDYVLYGPTEYIDKMKEVAKNDGFNKSPYRKLEFPYSLTGPVIVLGWRK